MTLAPVARLLLYIGALLVVGDAATGWSARRVTSRTPVATGWTLLAVAVSALWLLQVRDMELTLSVNDARMLLTQTMWGRGWSWLAASVVTGTTAFLLRAPRAITVLCVLAVALSMSGLGHAAADDAFPLLGRAVDSAHVLSVGAWIGGLSLLSWSARHRTRSAERTSVAQWERFSRMATIVAPIAVATGVLLAWRRLRIVPLDSGALTPTSLSAVRASEYGWLLLGKTVLVCVTLVLGLKHKRRMLGEHAPSATTVSIELAVALAVLAVTGLLTGTSPPGE